MITELKLVPVLQVSYILQNTAQETYSSMCTCRGLEKGIITGISWGKLRNMFLCFYIQLKKPVLWVDAGFRNKSKW